MASGATEIGADIAESKAEIVNDGDDAVAKKLYKERVYNFYREQVPENWDLTAERKERVWALPAFVKPLVVPMLENPEDYIAFELIVNATIGILPIMALFWVFPSHLFGLVFLVYRLLGYAGRFFLTLHVTSHRKLFKPEYWVLNYYAESVLSFTLGMPPMFYTIHHVMMHHCENNVFPYDISSTMPYQRNSISGLVHYISRYFTHATVYLPYYCWKRGRYSLLLAHLVCWVGYFVYGTYLLTKYPVFVMWTVHIPFFVVGCLLMKGNFAQHVFINPKDPFSNYSLAFNYINAPDNQKTYNDGYHIVHHLNSRLHWSQTPKFFEDNIEKFAEGDALVFKEADNDMVFWLVFTDQLERLYEHWVQLQPDNIRTVDQFKQLCYERFTPLHMSKPEKSE